MVETPRECELMKVLIRLEESALFLLSSYLFSITGFDWWWFPVLLFLPDVSMVGYLLNPKVGAYLYNTIHHRAVALLIYGFGLFWDHSLAILAGIILFAHSTLDRALGYGLKYSTSFFHTHLGKIGNDSD